MSIDSSQPSMHPSSELPKAADMLERLRTEAAELRNFTITFLSLLLYVAIIITSTTHEQILRIDPVELPLLDVEIPMVGFYWFMPGFLFFLHLYILVQHYLVSQLAYRFRMSLELETDQEIINHLCRSLGNLPFLHWLVGRQKGFINLLMTAFTVLSLIIWPALTFWWLQAAFLPYHDNIIVWTQRLFLFLDVVLLAYFWGKILDDQDDAGRWWKAGLAPLFRDAAYYFKVITNWLFRGLRLESWSSRERRLLGIEWLRIRLNDRWDLLAVTQPHSITWATMISRWLLLGFLLFVLFFSFIVSTIPNSEEEKWLSQHLPENWIDASTILAEERISNKGNKHRVFILTSLLHDQRRIWLNDYEKNNYDSDRIRNCDVEKAAVESTGDFHKGSPNNILILSKELEQKCYWIDSPFPRNLILHKKLLIANKEFAAESVANLSAEVLMTKREELSKVKGLILQGRHLEYADFSKSSLPNADMRRARLNSVNFSGAKLENVKLQSSELTDANLMSANLIEANLMNAKLSGSNMIGANFIGANLSGIKSAGSSWSGANLSGANLVNAELLGSNLDGANLSRAYLHWSNLTGANLSAVKLSGALLYETNLQGADLSNATLRGADLYGANLSGTILTNISFSPLDQKMAKVETDKLMKTLEILDKYQNEQDQVELAISMNGLLHEFIKGVDFSEIGAHDGCITDDTLVPCENISDPRKRKKAFKQWIRLLCQDDTEKQWVSVKMRQRATQPRFSDFALIMTANLHTPKECPSLRRFNEN